MDFPGRRSQPAQPWGLRAEWGSGEGRQGALHPWKDWLLHSPSHPLPLHCRRCVKRGGLAWPLSYASNEATGTTNGQIILACSRKRFMLGNVKCLHKSHRSKFPLVVRGEAGSMQSPGWERDAPTTAKCPLQDEIKNSLECIKCVD